MRSAWNGPQINFFFVRYPESTVLNKFNAKCSQTSPTNAKHQIATKCEERLISIEGTPNSTIQHFCRLVGLYIAMLKNETCRESPPLCAICCEFLAQQDSLSALAGFFSERIVARSNDGFAACMQDTKSGGELAAELTMTRRNNKKSVRVCAYVCEKKYVHTSLMSTA